MSTIEVLKNKVRNIVSDQRRDSGWIPQNIMEGHTLAVGLPVINSDTNPLDLPLYFVELDDDWLTKNNPLSFFGSDAIKSILILGDTREAEEYVMEVCNNILDNATEEKIKGWLDEYEA